AARTRSIARGASTSTVRRRPMSAAVAIATGLRTSNATVTIVFMRWLLTCGGHVPQSTGPAASDRCTGEDSMKPFNHTSPDYSSSNADRHAHVDRARTRSTGLSVPPAPPTAPGAAGAAGATAGAGAGAPPRPVVRSRPAWKSWLRMLAISAAPAYESG